MINRTKMCDSVLCETSVQCEWDVLKFQEAYEKSSSSRAHVFRWFRAFSESRELIEDEPRRGQTTSNFEVWQNIEKVRALVRSNLRLTVRMIGWITQLFIKLTENLEMRKVCANMVPRNLVTQRCQWMSIWLITTYLWPRNHFIPLIWVLVTSSYFPGLKINSKDVILVLLKTLNPPWLTS